MAGKSTVWSETWVERARLLVESHGLKGAAEIVSKERKHTVGWDALRVMLKSKIPGWTATKKGASAPTTAVDPVERVAAEKKEARVRREHQTMASELAAVRETMRVRDELASAPLKPIVRREFASGLREATAVAMLSDIHVEERVRASDTPTGNVYSLAIATLRLQRFFAGLIWLVKKERQAFKIRDLILWFGGDLVSGHIHDENVETSAMPPIAALLWLQPQLLDGVRQLLAELNLERLQLVCSYGNHGRDTKKSRRATGASHSYEWSMYQQLATLLADDKRVEVLANPAGHQYTQAYDFNLHFHHGDEIMYGGGVGGIMIPVNKAIARWDRVRTCHYHHFGHFHQYLDAGHITMNGSGIGFNAYAMSIGASPEAPQQAFYLLDSKRGKTAKSPIWVGDRQEEAKALGLAS